MPPIQKADAARALNILENYKSKLNNEEDEALRKAIERVTKIFESKLFNALIEISEYYEEILTDVHKSPEQVEREAAIIAKKWDRPTKKNPKGTSSKGSEADSDGESADHDPSVGDADSVEQSTDNKDDFSSGGCERSSSGGCDGGSADAGGDCCGNDD